MLEWYRQNLLVVNLKKMHFMVHSAIARSIGGRFLKQSLCWTMQKFKQRKPSLSPGYPEQPPEMKIKFRSKCFAGLAIKQKDM